MEHEADQRHGEIIVRDVGLTDESKPAPTPGIKVAPLKDDKSLPNEELGSTSARTYTAITARGNYLSQGRSDIQFAIKELSRTNVQATVTRQQKLSAWPNT